MNTKPTYAVSRRSLLRAIASAPLWHAVPARAIETAADAFDVFDLEAVARAKLPPAHWAYLATGTDSELTLNENTAAFSRWYLRPRRLVVLQRMRDSTHMRIVVKGIVTREDAARCLAAGVDGIIVSNHGGRSDDTGRAAIDSPPEVVAVAGGKVPVLVDSGFRRGTDVLKALALGASAVNIGRPYAWGLAAFGESGVARAMEIIRTELETNMRLVGAPSIADIGPDLVAHA